MHIIVTGICGFAGSVIARGLLEHLPGVKITGIDSLIRKGSETNLEPLRALGIDVRVGDIRNEEDLAALPAADWVLDCAANPSVLAGVDGKTSAKDLLDHNLGGTIHLLEYCRRHLAGFILLSTSRVYSIPPLAGLPVEVHNNAYRPVFDSAFSAPYSAAPSSSPPSSLDSRPALSPLGLTEQFSTEPPISLYGSSKKCSELLALEYGMTFDFPVRINRCGVLAGAGQFGKADQGIFSFWIHSWARRSPLKYIGFGGGGHQVRDCLHPRDIVPLLIAQMGDPGRKVEQILNVSGGVESAMSLAQLSAWCTDRLGAHQVVADTNPRPFDIPWMVLDSSAVKGAWNWKPSIPRETILEEIAIHAEQHPDWLNLVS
jgi:CDP-paratose 2-epimerase